MAQSLAYQVRAAMVTALDGLAFTLSSGQSSEIRRVRTGKPTDPTDSKESPYIHIGFLGYPILDYTPVGRAMPTPNFVITGYIKDSERSDADMDCDRLAVAIVAALGTDVTWGLAGVIDTLPQNIEIGYVSGKPWAACQINVNVLTETPFAELDG